MKHEKRDCHAWDTRNVMVTRGTKLRSLALLAELRKIWVCADQKYSQ